MSAHALRSPRAEVVCAALLAVSAALGADEPPAVTFKAADGMRLAADYLPPTKPEPPAPIVILLHAEQSDRTAWQPLVGPLHDAGFAVLAIDLRGHGESRTTETGEAAQKRDGRLFKGMQSDLRGAYDWLAQKPEVDRGRFVIVGAGAGAAVALRYAAADRSVDAVVCLSTILDVPGLDPLGDMRQISGRRVLLCGTKDEQPAIIKLKGLTKGAESRTVEGDARGTDMFASVSDLQRDICRFLKAAVGPPSDALVFCSIESENNVYHERGSGWVERIKPTNLRVLSSKQEAEARGLRAARSKGPDEAPGAAAEKKGAMDDKPRGRSKP